MKFLICNQWTIAVDADIFALSNNCTYMPAKRTIAIIGMGKTGVSIAFGLSGGNERVLLSDKNFNTAQLVVEQLQQADRFYDVEAIDCSYTAAWEADIIILTICTNELKGVADYIREVSTQKLIVSFTNTYEENAGNMKATDSCPEELAQLFPYSKIISAFLDVKCKKIEYTLSFTDKELAATANELFNAIDFDLIRN